MTKTSEQKFKLYANFFFEITLENLRDLFCTMGQDTSYWCHDIVVGEIKQDSSGCYILEDNHEYEGNCVWVKDLTLDTKIKILDIEEDEHEFQVKDVIKAIENIVSGKTNLNTYDCGQVFEAFKDNDLGLIDSSIADSILQITTYNTLVYG